MRIGVCQLRCVRNEYFTYRFINVYTGNKYSTAFIEQSEHFIKINGTELTKRQVDLV